MNNKVLREKYLDILGRINTKEFFFENDKYSGVFLPFELKEHDGSHPKIMVVGRETAGWNTNNGKNTIKRILEKNNDGTLDEIIDESKKRYSWHLKDGPSGKIKTTHRSHFQRYFYRIAKELKIDPECMIYSNLLAWDYNNKSPLSRPDNEVSKIKDLSLELLAVQIEVFKPDYIIFATGYRNIDPIIKTLFETHFDGYETININPKKLWEFKAANKKCFRIAHPRAQHGHKVYREEVINLIKNA